MIPLRDENPADRPAIITWTLIVLNVAAFVYELMLGPELRGFVFDWGLVPARVSASLAGGDESAFAAALPMVTSMFLHGGWMHLIGNMWYLAIFGDNVEDRLGRVGFLGFYLLAGLAGAVLHYVFNLTSRVPTVGASGAIAGVLGAYLVAFPGARVITLVPLFPFFQLMALPSVVVLGLWFVYQFFSGALSLAWVGRASGGGTAWWGHIGGFAFGVIAMLMLGRRSRSRASVA